MSRKKNEFRPPWSDDAPESGSYRSVFKWGDPQGFKHPNRKLYRYMKEQFNLTDDDFRVRVKEGREKVSVPAQPPLLDKKHREALAAVVGLSAPKTLPTTITAACFTRREKRRKRRSNCAAAL